MDYTHLSRASLRYAMSVLPHRYGQAQTCPRLLGAPEVSLVTSDFHLGGSRPCKSMSACSKPSKIFARDLQISESWWCPHTRHTSMRKV